MSNTDYVWIKFRTRHASGPGDWQYEEFAFDLTKDRAEELADALETLDNEHNTHSEYWRGIEGDIATPPVDWLRKHVARRRDHLSEVIRDIARAEKLISKNG